jgi:hypothetical protein
MNDIVVGQKSEIVVNSDIVLSDKLSGSIITLVKLNVDYEVTLPTTRGCHFKFHLTVLDANTGSVTLLNPLNFIGVIKTDTAISATGSQLFFSDTASAVDSIEAFCNRSTWIVRALSSVPAAGGNDAGIAILP